MTWLLILKRYWKPLALILALLAYGGFAYHAGAKTAKLAAQYVMASHLADDAKATQKLEQAARAHEQSDARKSAAIAQAYERGKTDGEAIGTRVADSVRAGAIQLRKQWRGCENRLPGVAAAPAEPDAAAQDRADGSGNLVRAAHDADAQITALQDLLRSERKP